jgi:hypothetical protein
MHETVEELAVTDDMHAAAAAAGQDAGDGVVGAGFELAYERV